MLFDNTILPGSSFLHANGAPVAQGQKPRVVRKSQSIAAFLSPLQLVKDSVWGSSDVQDTKIHGAGRVSSSPEEEGRRQALYLRLAQATAYEEWKTAAEELDELEGNNAWKESDESSDFDAVLIAARTKQLDEARISCDVGRMLFLIRTALTRGLGGMGDIRLYKHSHIGTKRLIERYIEAVQALLNAHIEVLQRTGDKYMEPRSMLEQLLFARQSFGRSALLLSGGGTFGMNHIGVVKALWQENLLPRIISGASAGSIVCSILCTKTDLEIPAVLGEFCDGDLAVFEKEGEDSVMDKAGRFLKHGALFDIQNLTKVMQERIGDLTFQEGYNRTRRILNITVSSASLYELPRLLNYITAPNVLIWSAVAASCSVPFIFSPAQLLARDPRTGEVVQWNPSPQKWIDGSVDNDLPMTRLAEMFNVNHFIVSQVNPHVVPFLMKEEDHLTSDTNSSSSAVAAGPGWLHGMANLAKGEALHRLHVMAEFGIFPTAVSKVRSILSQRYSGDITIFPEISYAQFPRVLSNPTPEYMQQAMLLGERAAWPKMSRIQNHLAIEMALDEAVQKQRARIAFSPSQIDLRLTAMTDRPATSSSALANDGRRRDGSSPPHKISRSSRRSYIGPEGEAETNVAFARPVPMRYRHSLLQVPQSAHPHSKHGKQVSLDTQPNLHLHIPPHELVSSSADDGDDNAISDTDAIDTGEESDTSSIESPPSAMPDLWPSTRQVFPSASLPTTPSITSRSFGKTPTNLSMTPSTPKQPPATTGRATGNTSSADAPPRPSSPELRYKRLFHSNPVRSFVNLNLRSAPAEAPGPGVKRSAHGAPKPSQGLKLDISGTRGMMLRRKRSSSTGQRGLRPPGPQL